MVMELSHTLPAKIQVETALWCKTQYLEMSQQFRKIRTYATDKMDKCWWCGHVFADGEMMALACFENKGNKVLCRDCALQLKASEYGESK